MSFLRALFLSLGFGLLSVLLTLDLTLNFSCIP